MTGSVVNGVPEGFHTVTANITVDGAAAAIEYYQRAFGAVEMQRSAAPDGKKIWHAEIRIGDTTLMLNDPFPEMGGAPAKPDGGHPFGFWLYVPDVDAVHAAAVAAGGRATSSVETQFWGDRTGSLTDPFGFSWTVATRVEEVSEEERKRRAAAFSG
ncbi:MAG: VOC family protein [Candidatus Dormibacteraeota bacterium]|nr:VOC family protein [Candidatus Dormibacteraeota bacterium]